MPELSDKQRWAREQAEEKYRAGEDRARAHNAVDLWNERLAAVVNPHFMPTVGGALLARKPWLIVDCNACWLQIDFDLRRHYYPAYSTVLMGLRHNRCPRCDCLHPLIRGLAADCRPRGLTK